MGSWQTWTAGAMLALLATPALAQKAPEKKVYCWNDGSGRRVCGDALPASAVDNARTEIDVDSGMPTRTLERAPTDAERAAAEVLARQQREHERAAAAEARREMAMVESYANEGELRRAFQHRLTLLEEAVKISRTSVVGMRQSLLGQLRRASEAELAGQPIAAPLASNIRHQHQILLLQQQRLVEQMHARANLDEELAAAVERYRALKSPEPERREG